VPNSNLQKKGTGNREQGTGNREQIRNTHLHQFKAQSKKRCFLRCVVRKKTVSLFQSHVFKHEFFLLESCPFPVPSEVNITLDQVLYPMILIELLIFLFFVFPIQPFGVPVQPFAFPIQPFAFPI
jgi:hypothetical protein